MENLREEELLQRIMNSKVGEQIFIPDSDGSIRSACEILATVSIAKTAYDNLFALLMTQRSELANTANVKDFMDEYVKNTMVYESTIQSALISAVGLENYKIINTMPGINLGVDYEINSVVLTNVGLGNKGHNKGCGCSI